MKKRKNEIEIDGVIYVTGPVGTKRIAELAKLERQREKRIGIEAWNNNLSNPFKLDANGKQIMGALTASILCNSAETPPTFDKNDLPSAPQEYIDHIRNKILFCSFTFDEGM